MIALRGSRKGIKRLKGVEMYRPARKRIKFNKALTKHGAGKVERRARIALLIGIGIGLATLTAFVLYMARMPLLFDEFLPAIVKATAIPLIIITFYIIGVLDADEDIYRESEDEDIGNKRK